MLCVVKAWLQCISHSNCYLKPYCLSTYLPFFPLLSYRLNTSMTSMHRGELDINLCMSLPSKTTNKQGSGLYYSKRTIKDKCQDGFVAMGGGRRGGGRSRIWKLLQKPLFAPYLENALSLYVVLHSPLLHFFSSPSPPSLPLYFNIPTDPLWHHPFFFSVNNLCI